jgi:hypothetical protein
LERERGALSLVANSFLAQEQVLGYVRRKSNMGTLISDLHTTTKGDILFEVTEFLGTGSQVSLLLVIDAI